MSADLDLTESLPGHPGHPGHPCARAGAGPGREQPAAGRQDVTKVLPQSGKPAENTRANRKKPLERVVALPSR